MISFMSALLSKLGLGFFTALENLLYASGFFFSVLKETLRLRGRNKVGYRVLVMQILFTGVNALSIISLISLAIGAVILIQGSLLLPQFGQSDLVYTLLITIIVKELGPILTAFIIMARSGVAIATELGTMVVNHEIEAYMATGINPISYLVVPRFLGVTISVVILNIYFSALGLGGSWVFSRFLSSISPGEYFGKLLGALQAGDLGISLLKSLVFGVIIALSASYNGFRVSQSSTEVPVTVIRAVGQGFVLLIAANVLITLVGLFL